MKARIFAGCVSAAMVMLVLGCAEHRVAKVAQHGAAAASPVVVAYTVREAVPNDYLRVSFLSANVHVTTIAKPGAVRGFVTATVLYSPPLTVAEYPKYSGLENDDSKVLVALRCKPPEPQKVDAVLATWPNVFAAVQRDVKLGPGSAIRHHPIRASRWRALRRGSAILQRRWYQLRWRRCLVTRERSTMATTWRLRSGCRISMGFIRRLPESATR